MTLLVPQVVSQIHRVTVRDGCDRNALERSKGLDLEKSQLAKQQQYSYSKGICQQHVERLKVYSSISSAFSYDETEGIYTLRQH
jgi:S-methylmethionine-dependent homocysteine/selenocysteine methylase